MQMITKQTAQLPLTVNPLLSAQRRACYAGDYPSVIWVRLAAATVGVVSRLRARLRFTLDTQQLIVISGDAAVDVSLSCQRCGECFTHTLSVSYCVSPVVSDDAAKKLPIAYDPLLLDQPDRLELVTLIEDELLLSLPLVAVHPREGCQPEILSFLGSPEPGVVAGDKNRPFTSLTQLKKKSLRSNYNGSTKKS